MVFYLSSFHFLCNSFFQFLDFCAQPMCRDVLLHEAALVFRNSFYATNIIETFSLFDDIDVRP